MNFVGALLCFWAGAGLLYLAIDPSKVSTAMTGKQGTAKQAGLGPGSLWNIYQDLLQPLGATSGR